MLYIGDDAVLPVKGVKDQKVTVGVRPEGFVLAEDGPLVCSLSRVEVMGRDISVVSTHKDCQAKAIRSIINAENKVDQTQEFVRFALKANKVLLFAEGTEERIFFENNGSGVTTEAFPGKAMEEVHE